MADDPRGRGGAEPGTEESVGSAPQTAMTLGPWTTRASRYTHENRWFKVRTDDVRTPAGELGEYNVIEIPPAVTIVALDSQARLCLLREFRYPHGTWLWETPVGSLDAHDADLLGAAQRELREEAGLTSADWSCLGPAYGLKGLSTQVLHTFLARDVTPGRAEREGVEAIDRQRFISFSDFFAEVRRHEITDAETIAAVSIAVAHLGLFS